MKPLLPWVDRREPAVWPSANRRKAHHVGKRGPRYSPEGSHPVRSAACGKPNELIDHAVAHKPERDGRRRGLAIASTCLALVGRDLRRIAKPGRRAREGQATTGDRTAS